ncbi:MAG TPA: prolipoprotein diacylglyceryl transferase [Flavobacterium sp.]|nr:prolipoprotein diacylglyceryl transferase [Flavobacterium sp.]
MTHLLAIVWNPSEGIQIGSFTLRFYSLMFVVAFALGWYLMSPIFKRENEPQEKLDSLFVYMVISILLGARLGHVLFYQSELILKDPLSVILPFQFVPEFKFSGFQGLASHGAAIAVIIAMYLYKTRILKRSYLWILDRIVIPVASGAIFVRLGNFFNSEIYGPVTSGDKFYAVKFIRDDEFWQDRNIYDITKTNDLNKAYDLIQNDPRFINTLNEIPFRHPAQLYEAVGYVFVFALLLYMYWKTDARQKTGLLFGTFLVTLFSIRILVESVKESQGGFENVLGYLTTGQWLSIPFVIVGIYLIFKAKKETV